MRHHQQIRRPKISMAKDTYDSVVFRIRELEAENMRLKQELQMLKEPPDSIQEKMAWVPDPRD